MKKSFLFLILFMLIFSLSACAKPFGRGGVDVNLNRDYSSPSTYVPPAVSVLDDEEAVDEADQSLSLEISWLAQAQKLKPEDLGLHDGVWYGYGNDMQADNIFTVYKVGTVKNSRFAGADLLLVKRYCYGPCGPQLYRVIDARSSGLGLIYLSKVSERLDPDDDGVFMLTDKYDIPALHLPDQIKVKYNGRDINLVAKYSPPEFLKDFQNRGPYGSEYKREIKELFIDPVYGKIYEDLNSGVLITELPDKLIKLYTLKMPFERTEYTTAHGFTPETYKVAVKLSDKWTWTGYFTPLTDSKCQIPVQYQIFRDIGDKLKIGGKIVPDIDYYVPKDPNDSYLLNSITMTEEQKTNMGDSPAVFFYKDELGRYIRFVWSELYWGSETECFW